MRSDRRKRASVRAGRIRKKPEGQRPSGYKSIPCKDPSGRKEIARPQGAESRPTTTMSNGICRLITERIIRQGKLDGNSPLVYHLDSI